MLAMKYINAFEDGCYAAISYRWAKSEWEDGAIGGYQCTTVGSDCPEICPVRDEIMDRVISFRRYKECDLFWIDQLCVDQQSGSRKQTAILAMHQVYRRSKFPLAMLSIPINDDDDLKLLSLILSEGISDDEKILQHPFVCWIGTTSMESYSAAGVVTGARTPKASEAIYRPTIAII
ncbi:hypothetical protein B0J12DRAFT_202569 [Macrophomina phaseolina]|uniref:Heterokaryon incompatibility domain-containing protein n=1 Tax=Macrophomina phaseolina TaxID=35725 RepID=A0ABQ8G2P8_9PEZI|nr:hypothetical protein B0J12DRAFT_202569 [Macrophomina phaseolina]